MFHRPFRAALAMLVLCSTLPVSAAPQKSAAPQAKTPAPFKQLDVSLDKNNLLTGQVLDAQGQPIAETKVWLLAPGGKPIPAPTNAQGHFAYQRVTPGVYYLQAGDTIKVCRVWTVKAAPPKSLKGLLFTADEATMRAQMGPPPKLNSFVKRSKKFLASPAGMVAVTAAIAAPIAIIAADDDNPPASP